MNFQDKVNQAISEFEKFKFGDMFKFEKWVRYLTADIHNCCFSLLNTKMRLVICCIDYIAQIYVIPDYLMSPSDSIRQLPISPNNSNISESLIASIRIVKNNCWLIEMYGSTEMKFDPYNCHENDGIKDRLENLLIENLSKTMEKYVK